MCQNYPYHSFCIKCILIKESLDLVHLFIHSIPVITLVTKIIKLFPTWKTQSADIALPVGHWWGGQGGQPRRHRGHVWQENTALNEFISGSTNGDLTVKACQNKINQCLSQWYIFRISFSFYFLLQFYSQERNTTRFIELFCCHSAREFARPFNDDISAYDYGTGTPSPWVHLG